MNKKKKKSDPVPDPVPDGVGKFGSGSEGCYTRNPRQADKLMCLPCQLLCQLQLTLFTFSPEKELGAEGKEEEPSLIFTMLSYMISIIFVQGRSFRKWEKKKWWGGRMAVRGKERTLLWRKEFVLFCIKVPRIILVSVCKLGIRRVRWIQSENIDFFYHKCQVRHL